MIDRILGDYVIVAKLGAGGMGEVYRARDAKLDRDVALALDERLPDAYRIQGSSQFYLEWNWDAVRRSWQRVTEFNPNDGEVNVSPAAFAAAMGQPEGTTAAFDVALESAPTTRNCGTSAATNCCGPVGTTRASCSSAGC